MVGEAIAEEKRGSDEDVRNIQIRATELQGRANRYAGKAAAAAGQ
jgi:hypothetical protein